MTISLAVFDLDGTLIDSRRDLADATNALIEELGGAALAVDQVTAMVGDGAAILVHRALEAAHLDPDTPGALDRFLEHYDERLTTHTRPYPGISSTLQALKNSGLTLAVLTNKPQRATNAILERLDLSALFADVVGGDTAAGRKPDPAGLLQIMRRLGASPASTVLVGDSPIDLETARRAGVRICLARYGFGYRFPEGSLIGDALVVESPEQLRCLLDGSKQENGRRE